MKIRALVSFVIDFGNGQFRGFEKGDELQHPSEGEAGNLIKAGYAEACEPAAKKK